MHSPVAPDALLTHDEIEPSIRVMRCTATGGVWIRSSSYLAWRERQGESQPEKQVDDGADLRATDSPAGKRCPEDGAFLIRHKVGHGLPFHVDRCGHCGGIWLDAGEWDALRHRNLHDDLHLIFTSTWQADVRAREHLAAADRLMRDKLGDIEWQRLQACRQWIRSHPMRAMLEAYLLES